MIHIVGMTIITPDQIFISVLGAMDIIIGTTGVITTTIIPIQVAM